MQQLVFLWYLRNLLQIRYVINTYWFFLSCEFSQQCVNHNFLHGADIADHCPAATLMFPGAVANRALFCIDQRRSSPIVHSVLTCWSFRRFKSGGVSLRNRQASPLSGGGGMGSFCLASAWSFAFAWQAGSHQWRNSEPNQILVAVSSPPWEKREPLAPKSWPSKNLPAISSIFLPLSQFLIYAIFTVLFYGIHLLFIWGLASSLLVGLFSTSIIFHIHTFFSWSILQCILLIKSLPFERLHPCLPGCSVELWHLPAPHPICSIPWSTPPKDFRVWLSFCWPLFSPPFWPPEVLLHLARFFAPKSIYYLIIYYLLFALF